MQKKDILARLKAFGRPETVSRINLLESVQSGTTPKSDNSLIEQILKTHASEKPAWRPAKTSTKEIWQRWLVEATDSKSTDRANAMRLNLQPIAIDRTHLKFSFNRNGNEITTEIMYPNKNNNITVKVSTSGADDNIKEVNTEDAEYVNGIGFSIIKMADESLANASISNQDDRRVAMDYGHTNAGVSGYSPNWENNSGMWESDNRKFSSLMTLVEQEEEELANEQPDMMAGDVNMDPATASPFDEEAFSTDATGPIEMGGFGGGGGGGDFSGGGGGGPEGAVGTEMGGVSGPEDTQTFSDFSPKLQIASLATMRKLIADAEADSMKGEAVGVKLTSNQILNGTVGLNNQPNYQTIADFLKIYPELDGIEISETWLERIDDKLAEDDGEWNAWLQEELPEITNQQEVDDVLNNDMFSPKLPMEEEAPMPEMAPMGGEEMVPGAVPPMPGQGDEEFKTTDEIQAEKELGLPKVNEFAGI